MSQLRANGVLILVGLLLAASQCEAGDILSSFITKMPKLPLELEPLVSIGAHARFVGDNEDYEILTYEIEPEHFEKTLASFVRQEMGSLFAEWKLPSLEEFGRGFREKFVEPCQRLHPLLEGWWQVGKISPSENTEPENLWLITEHLCSKIATKEDDDALDRLIRFVYTKFELKYQQDLNQEKKREKFTGEIDTIMEKATIPLHYDRMVSLVQLIEKEFGARIRSILDKLGGVNLVGLLANHMIEQLEPFVEENGIGAVDRGIFLKEFKRRIWIPCETLSKSLESWYSLYAHSLQSDIDQPIRENERSWYLALFACQNLFSEYKREREQRQANYIFLVRDRWLRTISMSNKF